MFLLGQQLGKYQILKTLGSGGFGTVYLVKDTWIDKKFAIKVPHKQSGEMGDLLQEPRLLAAMDHKNIVRIVTAEKADDYFFIVMEYVEGEDLEDDPRTGKNDKPSPRARLDPANLYRCRSRSPSRRAASRPETGKRLTQRKR